MHPTFVQLGPLTIATYGVMVALGFLVGLGFASRQARAEGIAPAVMQRLGAWLVVSGILGGKLFYVMFFWPDFVAGWQERGWGSLREGFVFFGGFLLAAAGLVIFARRERLPLGALADALAPGLALGHGLGRLGCFFNGCCYGSPTSLPWGVTFPPPHVMAGVTVHPTQLYEAAGNLLIAVGLWCWRPHRRFAGQLAWGYAFLYGALRLGVEFFRGDYPRRFVWDMTLGQIIAVGVMIVAVVGHEWSCRQSRCATSR